MLAWLVDSTWPLCGTLACTLLGYRHVSGLLRESGVLAQGVAFACTYGVSLYLALFLARNVLFVPTQVLNTRCNVLTVLYRVVLYLDAMWALIVILS